MRKKIARYSALSSAYLLLAILFTWPLVMQLTTHGFGVDEDSPYHIWHNWWFKFSIFDLHQSPLFTDYIFHPQNIPLVFDANAFVFSSLTLPLQLFTSVLAASNIILIFSFVLSGIGTYFLAKYALEELTRERLTDPAKEKIAEIMPFIAGLIFAFSPYTLAQAIDGHINLTTTWILPFYTYFLLKALTSSRHPELVSGPLPSQTSGFRNLPRRVKAGKFGMTKVQLKYALTAGIFAGLQALNDLTYTAFTIIFTGLIILYLIFPKEKQALLNIKKLIHQFANSLIRLIPPLTIIAITSLIIFLPAVIPTMKVYRMGLKPDAPLWVQNVWSADLIAFFRPSDHSTFLKPISHTPPRGTVEGTVFIGYTVMILATISIFSWIRSTLFVIPSERSESRDLPRDSSTSPRKGSGSVGMTIETRPSLWIFLAASFFIFSLGPFLKIGDTWQWNIFGHQLPIPLPFIFLHKIPLIGGTQEPARMNPFLMLPMAILAANGICILSDCIDTCWLKERGLNLKTTLRFFLVSCFLSLITFEFLQLPFPTTNLEPPPIYEEIAKDPEYFSVLTLPVGFNSGQIALGKSPIGSLQYYQVIHQKPSFRGTVARLPAWAFDYYRDLPLFRIFIDPNRPPEQKDLDKETVQKLFKEQLHIKYIVIHKDKFENGLEKAKNLIEEVLEAEKIEESHRTISYVLK